VQQKSYYHFNYINAFQNLDDCTWAVPAAASAYPHAQSPDSETHLHQLKDVDTAQVEAELYNLSGSPARTK
jgi:hypothetical protein